MRNFVNRIIQIIHFYLLGPFFCHILGPFCMTCIYILIYIYIYIKIKIKYRVPSPKIKIKNKHRRVVPGTQNSQGKGKGGGRKLGSVRVLLSKCCCLVPSSATIVKKTLIYKNIYIKQNENQNAHFCIYLYIYIPLSYKACQYLVSTRISRIETVFPCPPFLLFVLCLLSRSSWNLCSNWSWSKYHYYYYYIHIRHFTQALLEFVAVWA